MSGRYSETIKICIDVDYVPAETTANGCTLPGGVFAVTNRYGQLNLTHKPTGWAVASRITSFVAGKRAAEKLHRLPVDWSSLHPKDVSSWPDDLRAKARAIRLEAEGKL